MRGFNATFIYQIPPVPDEKLMEEMSKFKGFARIGESVFREELKYFAQRFKNEHIVLKNSDINEWESHWLT